MNNPQVVNTVPQTQANPLLGMRRPIQNAEEGSNNENECYIGCMTCCGAVCNTVCFPCCLVCGCNRVVVRQGEAGIMLRNGRFYKSLPPGLYMINNCLYTVTIISVKSRVASNSHNQLITKDNMTVTLGIYVNYEIEDPYAASLGVLQLDSAILNIAQGKLKNRVSTLKFQDLLKSSSKVNEYLKQSMADDLVNIGIIVINAEVTSIMMSNELTLSMAQVAISERDKEAQIRMAKTDLETSKLANEAAAILKDQQNSLDLHFFETIKNVAKSWNETVITADGMLYIPKNLTKKH